jgi:hypothetical protein
VADVRAAGAAVVVLAVMTLAACSTTESGQPNPASGSSGQASPNDPATVSLPPRPRDISMVDVDPCALLTAAQRAQFQVHPGVTIAEAIGVTGRVCGYQFDSEAGGQEYTIAATTSPGIEHWLNPYLTDNITQVSIGGFPAVDITAKLNQATGCQTAVSVAKGQMLEVGNGVDVPGMTQAQSCARTNQVADAALATLQTLK